MARPAIVWRNPKSVQWRRLWNQARQNQNSRVYVVVRSRVEADAEAEWEGLPNLEVIDCKESMPAARKDMRELCSRR